VLNPIHSSQFKRDVKVAKKRGKDMDKLRVLLILLLEENRFPQDTWIILLKVTGMVIETHTSNRIGY
jgi:hypothetical protein